MLIVLNEGALDLAMRGDAFIRTATFSSVASTQEYVLSGASPQVSNFLDVYWPAGGLTYTGTDGKIKTAPANFTVVSEKWLNLHVPGWRDTAASDTLQYAYLGWQASGYLILGAYPKSKTAITNAYKLWYKSRGTDMAADGDYPWTGGATNLTHTEPWQKAIAEYAKWQIHEQITKIQSLAEKHRDVYLALAEELRVNQEKLFEAEVVGLQEAGHLDSGESFGSL